MIPVFGPARAEVTMGGALAALHEQWMDEVTAFLAPALNEESDLWARWSGARFLDDQFGDRFRLECALLDAVTPRLPEGAAAAIAAARAEVERIAEELTAAGRRRATGALTARLARRFIDQLALWCIEVELATARLSLSDLPRPANRLLTMLRVAALWQ